MQQFYITDPVIYNHAATRETFKRGILYNQNHRVRNFQFDEDKLVVNAIVRGSEDYDVTMFLNEKGQIYDYTCDCMAFYGYSGACKHIVAVMKTAQTELSNHKSLHTQNQKTLSEIFSFFANLRDDSLKQTVQTEFHYEYSRENYDSFVSTLELRIGTGRLYVVRNLKDFLQQLYNQKSYEFGKNFTFDPEIHTFSETDKKVMDILMEIYENEINLSKKYRYTYHTITSSFNSKKVSFTSPYLLRIFNALKGKGFSADILGNKILDISIIEENIPLNFSLTQNNNRVRLLLENDNSPIPLTEKGIYFYINSKIYNPPKKQQKYYLPFLSKLIQTKEKSLSFSPAEMSRFVSEVMPYVKNLGNISMDKKIEENLIKEVLQPKIYFDKYKEGISAKVEFHYGNNIANPFSTSTIMTQDEGKILVRDIETERDILQNFENAEFNVEKDKIYLIDEEKIYDFLNLTLPKLQEISEVYYSEAFKNIKIKYPSSFTGGVKLNKDSNMLEFSFNYEDISSDELNHIFSSIKEKKKYYRLKDGSFIPLDDQQLMNMSDLVEQLDISGKDLAKKVIELPKYRAMYIDSLIRESNLNSIERNQDFKLMVQNVREPGDMEFQVPEPLRNVLRDYQKTGFKWLKTLEAYEFGGILADDMGLGKTIQVISFVLSQKGKDKTPSLVIAPTSLVYNWKEEVKKFVPDLDVLVISGEQKGRHEQLKEIENADLVVTSYPLIRRDIELYKDIKFLYCFLDEAQHIKNPNTLNAKSVKQINSRINFALTGTPIENSITELWSIFDFVMPGYLLSHSKFVKKFESPIIKNNDQKALGELGRHIRPFIMRRMKKDVLKELPDKIENKMTCEMTDEQKKIYLAYLQKAKAEIATELKSKGFEKSQIKILSILTRLRQICCHPGLFIENFEGESGKMQLLQEILEDAFDSGHRILLFSQFTSMLDIIKNYLADKNIEYFYLDGSTKSEDRLAMANEFNKGVGKLFLISLKAGGTGLNLTGADMVIHYDPWWNPAVEDQASDRAHRIGQKNVVHVMKLITQGTIEEKIYLLQQSKKEIIDSVIKPGETLISKMSEEEIMGLFEL